MREAMRALLQRAVAVHPIIIKVTGSVKLAMLWDQIRYWSDKTNDPNGWVYKSQEELFDETGIKRRGIDTARAAGKKLRILDSEVRGTPPTVHYRIDEDRMIDLIEDYLKKNPAKKIRSFEIKKTKKQVAAIIEIPEWIDKKVWSDWEEYRKEKKQKLTPMTIKQQIKFLDQHRAYHIQIIQTSIQNGWRGLFAPKKFKNDNQVRQEVRREVDKKADEEMKKYMKPLTEEETKKAQEKLKEVRNNLKNKFILRK